MDKELKVLKMKDAKLHKEIKLQALREDLTVEQLTEKVFRQYLRTRNRAEKVAA